MSDLEPGWVAKFHEMLEKAEVAPARWVCTAKGYFNLEDPEQLAEFARLHPEYMEAILGE